MEMEKMESTQTGGNGRTESVAEAWQRKEEARI